MNEELVTEKLAEEKRLLSQSAKSRVCKVLSFVKNIGLYKADDLIAKNRK